MILVFYFIGMMITAGSYWRFYKPVDKQPSGMLELEALGTGSIWFLVVLLVILVAISHTLGLPGKKLRDFLEKMSSDGWTIRK